LEAEMMICGKCGYEIEGRAYCQSCFELLLVEIYKLKKQLEQLQNENHQLKNKIEIMKIEGVKPWGKHRR
jgi:hypothetical protein